MKAVKVFFLCAGLCAGGGAVRAAELHLTFETGPSWHHLPLMQGALEQFVAPARRGQAAPGPGLGVQIGAVLDTRVIPQGQWALGLALQERRPLAAVPGLTGHWRLGAAVGSARYRLPVGIGPFLDPMDIRISHAALSGELGLGTVLRQRRTRLEAQVLAGAELLRGRGRFDSALIALSRTEDRADPYLGLALSLHDPGALRYETRLRWSPRFGLQLSVGGALPLGRRAVCARAPAC